MSRERMTDIYDTEKRYMKEFSRISEWKISEKDKDLFIRFLRSMQARGIGIPQLLKYVWAMKTFLRSYEKTFDEINREDLEEFILSMDALSVRTRKTRWYGAKKFFEWLDKKETFFKVHFRVARKKMPEQVLTRNDIDIITEKSKRHDIKYFIYVLYESGARIGELLNLKASDVSFDENGAILIVEGKTGQRRVRIVQFAPALKSFMLRRGKQGDDRIFTMSYQIVCKNIRESAWRAGVRKPVNPHAFRHARATHLANFLTESQLKEFFGWRQGSDMAQIYVHLSGRDIDEAILKTYHEEETLEVRKKMGIG